VSAVLEKTIVQMCIVPLLRNSFRYASKRDWAQLAKDLEPVYTAASEAEALDRFAEFSGKWEKRYPAIIRLRENGWAEFVPFLAFDREIRTVICTTNASRSTPGCAAR
jgi:putative transposase